jgi:hypothetical protein
MEDTNLIESADTRYRAGPREQQEAAAFGRAAIHQKASACNLMVGWSRSVERKCDYATVGDGSVRCHFVRTPTNVTCP